MIIDGQTGRLAMHGPGTTGLGPTYMPGGAELTHLLDQWSRHGLIRLGLCRAGSRNKSLLSSWKKSILPPSPLGRLEMAVISLFCIIHLFGSYLYMDGISLVWLLQLFGSLIFGPCRGRVLGTGPRSCCAVPRPGQNLVL